MNQIMLMKNKYQSKLTNIFFSILFNDFVLNRFMYIKVVKQPNYVSDSPIFSFLFNA